MKKSEIVQQIFRNKLPNQPENEKGIAFAPTNIALCKYWGKRNTELNLPMTSSLSVALPDRGAMTSIRLHDKAYDSIVVNGNELALDSEFAVRSEQFLDLFRPEKQWRAHIEVNTNIPIAAGLASSASGYASLVLALKDLFKWKVSMRDMTILARLGSGSAARSFWPGFVEWHAGVQADGMDCYAEPLLLEWPDLYLGILPLSYEPKAISSREAMQRTINSSLLYAEWPKKVSQDMAIIKQALQTKNFSLLGGTVESNALTMHATMLGSWPPICYYLPETIANMHVIWDLRRSGLELYFTQDAGPNLKLLFLERDKGTIRKEFPTIEMMKVFD